MNDVWLRDLHSLNPAYEQKLHNDTLMLGVLAIRGVNDGGGLLRVVPGEVRRTRVVTLPRKGKRTLTQALRLWQQAQQRVVSQLGEGRSARRKLDGRMVTILLDAVRRR